MHTRYTTPILGALIITFCAGDALAQRGGRAARQQATARAQQNAQPPRTTVATRTATRSRTSFRRAGQDSQHPFRSQIQQITAQMESAVQGNATPVMRILPATRSISRFQITRQPDYKGNVTAQFEVSGLGAGGDLPLTILFPVSGHVGAQQAQQYAQSNVYKVELQRPDGTLTALGDVKSTGVVTEIAQNLKLAKGTNILRVWPSATAVDGFRPGREIELVWDGQ